MTVVSKEGKAMPWPFTSAYGGTTCVCDGVAMMRRWAGPPVAASSSFAAGAARGAPTSAPRRTALHARSHVQSAEGAKRQRVADSCTVCFMKGRNGGGSVGLRQ